MRCLGRGAVANLETLKPILIIITIHSIFFCFFWFFVEKLSLHFFIFFEKKMLELLFSLGFRISIMFVLDHIATALHLFSACTLDVTSTVMTRTHVRSSLRAHSPLSGSSVNGSCAQDTEQKHGKHGSGAPLSSFPLLLVVVLAEHGGCLSSSVDHDRELRIWSDRGAREELVIGVIPKAQIFIGCWS